MDFITIAKQRMSVRNYKKTKVEPEKLEKILEAAHVAPTAANLQPVHLIDHPLHYMELQRLIPNATPKMLSQQLHDLENNGMIHREVIPEKPPKTVYSLTSFGQSIVPILDAMCQWGNSYLGGLDVQTPCCQSRK